MTWNPIRRWRTNRHLKPNPKLAKKYVDALNTVLSAQQESLEADKRKLMAYLTKLKEETGEAVIVQDGEQTLVHPKLQEWLKDPANRGAADLLLGLNFNRKQPL